MCSYATLMRDPVAVICSGIALENFSAKIADAKY
jgi:hypothetical protein